MFGGGFGGFPFGGGFHQEEEEETYEKDTKLYDIMGLEKTATSDQIRSTYKKLSLKLHPDKGGSQEQFKELQMANSVLSNPEKREVYDKYGLKGIQQMDQGGAPGGGMDIFSHFFGGGGGGRQKANQVKKCKPQVKEVAVTLEDIYLGKSIKLNIQRKRVCEGCNGAGGSNVQKCTPCKGQGRIQKMMMLGPGMYQHVEQACKDCGGEGKRVDPKDICKDCKGNKIFEKKKELDVYVEPGSPNEHVMNFYGEGDEYPGISAGDVQVVVRIQKHKIYQRKGADIFMVQKIQLVEALTGFVNEIQYLDGKKFGIKSEEGDIISDSMIKKVEGKGLPFFKDAMGHGNLYIQFNVQFPNKGELAKQHFDALKQLLPGGTKPKNITTTDIIKLTKYNESDLNENEEGGKKKEEEEEHQNAGQRVQCQQQ